VVPKSKRHDPKLNAENQVWLRRVGSDGLSLLFATAFKMRDKVDLTAFAKTLPEGVVLCDPKIVAGISHIEAILLQTREYWLRNQRLVKNGSIEILMRLSGKSQIMEAVEASGLKDTKAVALLGFASTEKEIQGIARGFLSTFKSASQDFRLLELNKGKAKWLKKFHELPLSLTEKELLIALQELSVLLIFSK
jgi:tRNA threonylcarbamoyladenosine modification (KEOPS) complex Cgi121 subunit